MANDQGLELTPPPSRFVVGIDLGTTNSALCYVDTAHSPWRIQVLDIPQFVAAGQIEARPTLPSFHYQPPANQVAPLPVPPPFEWPRPYVVGQWARDAADSPGRVIASAKSWLCHSGVDRTAPLLPWQAADDVARISPVETSSRYLAHLRSVWNRRFHSHPLEAQDVVLTLPASFDEVARELTVQAAAAAGLTRVVLIEEPQAAFYAWIYKHQTHWDQLVRPGQKILVCDVGGGTTDFTLIRVRRGSQGQVQFHRVAVGDHLLLGGDNMDLALAHYLEPRLLGQTSQEPASMPKHEQATTSKSASADRPAAQPHDGPAATPRLPPRQFDLLVRLSRQVKERMLSEDAPAQLTVTLPGSGAQLLSGARSVRVTRDEVRQLLVDGFLPRVALTDRPRPRRSGFQEFGLPYVADPAITRHLAAFLTAHRHAGDEPTDIRAATASAEAAQRAELAPGPAITSAGTTGDPARPEIVLFNGGVFESSILRQRVVECLVDWFGGGDGTSGEYRPQVLDNDQLSLAVARGAAYYGMVRRGEGVKIVASLARTYYVGVDTDPPAAVCLVPGSTEPGQAIDLTERPLELRVGEPAEFPLYSSSVRLTDPAGALVPVDPQQMTALPPLRTVLKTRSRRERGTLPVTLHAELTEIGTLELSCREIGGDRSWRLQFDVRAATQTDLAPHVSQAEGEGWIDEAVVEACREQIDATFGPQGASDPGQLVRNLVAAVGSDRSQWPTSLLRRIAELLLKYQEGRRKSPAHEARWLNLLGYCLRPGYGLAVDDWRVAETWKTVQGKLAHPAATSRTESLILWRRIAGGLSAGQQRALADPLMAAVRSLQRRTGGGRTVEPLLSPHESVEVFRLLGALERLPVEMKQELGRILLDLATRKKHRPLSASLLWSLGRLGAREPTYGPLNAVVPAEEVAQWLTRLWTLEAEIEMVRFAAVHLARRTGDRFRDLDEPKRAQVLAWLTAHGGTEHDLQLVREGGTLDDEEQGRVFGESLPKGLRLR